MNEVTNKIPREAFIAATEYLRSLPQLEEPEVRHHFASGVYCRELILPANVVGMGKIHKHETLNIILKGKIEVAMEDGGTKIIEAPSIFVSAPGNQKLVKTLEDTIFLNIHATQEKDLDKIEEQFIAKTFEEYDQFVISYDKKNLQGIE